jgi:hypothetical protein
MDRDFSFFLTGLNWFWEPSNFLCGEYLQLFTQAQNCLNVDLPTRQHLVQRLIMRGTIPRLRTRLYVERSFNIA